MPISRLSALGNRFGILGENNSKAQIEMPVNVTMEDPWSRIIRLEANGDIITCGSCADNVALDRIDIVIHRTPSTANYGECMTVKMEWMRGSGSSSRDRDFYNRVVRYGKHRAGREQVLSRLCAAQDL